MVEEEFELVGDVGPRKIEAFVAEELLFHLGQLLLGGVDLSEDERDLLGDEGDVLLGVVEEVLGVVVFWGRCEGVEGEQVCGEDRQEHENVHCGGAQGGSSESGGAVADLQRNRPHLGSAPCGSLGRFESTSKWIRECLSTI